LLSQQLGSKAILSSVRHFLIDLSFHQASLDNLAIRILIKNIKVAHRNKRRIMEEVDWSSLHKILSDPTRRNILELLTEKEELSYTEIMALLRITNTGRLNYHLKALSVLVSKDEEGKYHLTEKGKLAANMLKTFPERVPIERKKISTAKIVAAVLLILIGIGLIFSTIALALFFVTAPASAIGTVHTEIPNRAVPKNTTIFLTSLPVQNGSDLNIDWIASDPLYIYVMNSTQYDSLLIQHGAAGQIPTNIENFTGMPTEYLNRYDSSTGTISLSLPQSQYYFFAWSSNDTILDTFMLTQRQLQPTSGSSSFESLIVFLPGGFGIILIVLAILILTRHVWR
jgi:DNA-binding transcriptional ArsR family regulator